MPSDFVLKSMNQIHRQFMGVTGGKLGWSLGKMPVLELTTTGRKSGKKRPTLLTAPWTEGESMAIVASAGGNDDHPAWFLNLRDDPSVTVKTEDETKEMVARILEGEERAEMWKTISTKYKNYAGYQRKTDREIPIVILEPVTA